MKFNHLTGTVALLAATLVFSCSRVQDAGGPPETPTSEAVVTATDAQPHPGEALYLAHCAACHDQVHYKAPSRLFISMLGPANLLHAMNDGLMAEQAAAVAPQDRKAIAEFLSGQTLESMAESSQPPACSEQRGFDAKLTPVSSGWGVDLANTRFHPAATGGLTAAEVPGLEVKWAFAFPHATKARSQPTYGGGAVYFGSQDGAVRALDAKTGCLRWTFRASAEVRTAIVISPWFADDEKPDPTLYFGDLLGRAYAISARTGELRWITRVDDHRDATITGTPTLHGGRLYVPVSSLEVVAALDPGYACCTFRGSVVALDATSGGLVWKSYATDHEPAEAGKNSAGTPVLAPSGAPVWNSPTIDLKRNRLYVGTGENYSSPADGNSDAIIAFDLETGAKLWVSQQTAGDAWNTACLSEFTSDDANCPEENGPDYDFGSSPILLTLEGGRDLLVAGQKSGAVMAIDPDSGETVWKTQVGRGGVQGGIHFGMAADGARVYVPINDMVYPEDVTRYQYTMEPRPGLYALDAASGELLWSTPAPDICGDLQYCDPGISQAILAIPGAVIAGHLDGRLRAYAAETGDTIWELDTLREFASVSGEPARGGSLSGDGGVVAHGMLYINSGYGIYGHMPGNVLLAIGPAE
jgi:polyvinyl alcohol dehydrogenase (cytochrome)